MFEPMASTRGRSGRVLLLLSHLQSLSREIASMSTCLGKITTVASSSQSNPFHVAHIAHVANSSLAQRDARRVRDCLTTARDMTRPDGGSKRADIFNIVFSTTLAKPCTHLGKPTCCFWINFTPPALSSTQKLPWLAL
jgi:hypothetical protein